MEQLDGMTSGDSSSKKSTAVDDTVNRVFGLVRETDGRLAAAEAGTQYKSDASQKDTSLTNTSTVSLTNTSLTNTSTAPAPANSSGVQSLLEVPPSAADLFAQEQAAAARTLRALRSDDRWSR